MASSTQCFKSEKDMKSKRVDQGLYKNAVDHKSFDHDDWVYKLLKQRKTGCQCRSLLSKCLNFKEEFMSGDFDWDFTSSHLAAML